MCVSARCRTWRGACDFVCEGESAQEFVLLRVGVCHDWCVCALRTRCWGLFRCVRVRCVCKSIDWVRLCVCEYCCVCVCADLCVRTRRTRRGACSAARLCLSSSGTTRHSTSVGNDSTFSSTASVNWSLALSLSLARSLPLAPPSLSNLSPSPPLSPSRANHTF